MTFETFISHIKKYRNIYVVAGIILLFVIMASVLFDSCGDYFFNRDIEKNKNAVNSLMNDANAIKNDLSNLKIKEALAQSEVNKARETLFNAQSSTNTQQVITNAQLTLVNAIEKSKEVNVTLQEVEKNRCLAFPEDCD